MTNSQSSRTSEETRPSRFHSDGKTKEKDEELSVIRAEAGVEEL